MTEPRFEPDALAWLGDAREVHVETRAADGSLHRTIIWAVVDDAGRVLVRSWRGASARWYREATSGRPVELVIGDESTPVHVEHAVDDERVAACSQGLRRKYRRSASVWSMLRDEILDTTLELLPAEG